MGRLFSALEVVFILITKRCSADVKRSIRQRFHYRRSVGSSLARLVFAVVFYQLALVINDQ